MEARREIMHRERIVDIEFKISRLGILGKEYYDLAQIKLKRHRTHISIARTQNVLLHAALSTLREKDRIARKNAGDLENLRKKAAALRVHFDHQRQRVFKRQRKLEWQITGTHSAELECAGVLDPNTSPELRIRSLEHKLGLVQIKMQDVQILVKHYEGTLLPLRDEWIVYDSKLAALQEHVNIKNQECELLINTHHDAIRARDAAKIELEELLAFVFGYGKKGIISPELRSKILRAIKEIKSVMDVESMREMYHQFLVQEKQSSYLESIYEEMSRTLDLMRDDDYRPSRRKSSIKDKEYAERVIEGTTMIVRRQSEWKGSLPLLQLLESTKSLVNRLHEGQILLTSDHNIQKEILEKCRLSMVQILQSLYRQLKRRNKDTVRRAEFEAKEAAHWAKEEAEVARKKLAAEEARRKYDERTAAREAQREEEEALRQIMEASQEAADDMEEQSHALIVDHPSDLPVGMTQEETEDIVSSADEGVLGSHDQLAKEAEADEMGEPTVIFLPSFPQSPSDDRELRRRGRATASSSDESEAKIERSAEPGPSAPMSDDESIGASTVDEGGDGRGTPSTVAGATFTETRAAAVSSRFGRAATFTETRAASVSSRLGRAATFTETVRPPAASSRIGLSPDVETVSPREQDKVVTPTASLLEPDELPAVALASEEGVEQKPVIPTELAHSGDFKEATLVMSEEKSIESTAESMYEGGASIDSALPDTKSPTVDINDQVSTTEPTPGSGMRSGDDTASPQLSQIIGEFPPVALEARVEVSTISEDSHEKAAEQKEEGSPLNAVTVSSETVQSSSEEDLSSLTAVSSPVSSDVTVETSLPRSPSGAPITSAWGTGEAILSPESEPIDETLPQTPGGGLRSPDLPRSPSSAPISTESPFAVESAMHGDERAAPHIFMEEIVSTATPSDALAIEGKSPTVPSESGAGILSQRLAGTDVLPVSPSEGPESAEVPAAELLPSTPGEMPGAARTSISRGKGVADEESAGQSPRTAEIRLPRSPSGAPIASGWEQGSKVPSPETVSHDESFPQTFGGLRSPNLKLPRSPSGAPIATAAKFPFGSNLSETSSPAGSSGMGRSPTDTARLPTTSLEGPVPNELRLSETDTEPGAPATSDRQE